MITNNTDDKIQHPNSEYDDTNCDYSESDAKEVFRVTTHLI